MQRDQQQRTQKRSTSAESNTPSVSTPATLSRKKLSYKEAREYANIERQIAAAEARLVTAQSALNDPAIQTDAPALIAAQFELEQAASALDQFLIRWTELEEKQQ